MHYIQNSRIYEKLIDNLVNTCYNKTTVEIKHAIPNKKRTFPVDFHEQTGNKAIFKRALLYCIMFHFICQ